MIGSNDSGMRSGARTTMDHEMALGTKTFDMEDQRLMAQWSGDHNPMHVDAVTARRLLTGRPVVHGVHLVLEALARWQRHGGRGPCQVLRAEFSKPVSVGDQVTFRASERDGGVDISGIVEGVVHMTMSLESTGTMAEDEELPEGEGLPWSSTPMDWPACQWQGRTVVLPPTSGSFPVVDAAAALMGPDGAAALGQASTMVGMGCPGLHSVFSSISLTRRSYPSPTRCRVDRLDARFGLVRMTLDGNWYGQIRAFVRAAPRPQADMAAVNDTVRADLLALQAMTLPSDHRTWVIGGSRGLGELAAKIAAAAGSQVMLTYAQGRDDAHRVVEDINRIAQRPAKMACFEVGQTDIQTFSRLHGLPDMVLYFATPRIARRRHCAFQPELLATFNAVYCTEPARIALALETLPEPQGIARPRRLFNPSSTYIDELPNGMVEYAMAKAAAEVMAADLNKRLRQVQILGERLPRLLTDQTNSLIRETGPSALEILRPILLRSLGLT